MKKTQTKATDFTAQIETLTKERDQQLATAQKAIEIANSFGSRLSVIEQLTLSPTFAKPGKGFLSGAWWVLLNFKEIVTFIKTVIEQIKSWREDINSLAASQQNNG